MARESPDRGDAGVGQCRRGHLRLRLLRTALLLLRVDASATPLADPFADPFADGPLHLEHDAAGVTVCGAGRPGDRELARRVEK